ncbi:hypothetical protein ACSMXM_14165 [Pacificimonas sp. ICDLI1SI03]
MAFSLEGDMIVAIIISLLVGLLLGWLLFRGAGSRRALQAELAERNAELAVAHERNAALEREVASSRDQIKPLADEVDRLRAMKARPALSETPATAAPVTPRADTVTVPDPTKRMDPTMSSAEGEPDDLQLIKGIGPKLESIYNDLGVWHFAQIADWSPDDVRTIDAKLGTFKGRIERDQHVEQAKLLAAGRTTEYEARFGKLGRPT